MLARTLRLTLGGFLVAVLAVLAVAALREEPVRSAPLVGQPAPDFEIPLFAGGTLRLSQLTGQVVVLNFWASWCIPCREEAPLLEWAWRRYREAGVVVVGVNLWDTDRDARAFLQEFGQTFPTGPDASGRSAIAYGVTGIPETFLIDRAGVIRWTWKGTLTKELIVQAIETLIDSQ